MRLACSRNVEAFVTVNGIRRALKDHQAIGEGAEFMPESAAENDSRASARSFRRVFRLGPDAGGAARDLEPAACAPSWPRIIAPALAGTPARPGDDSW